MLCLQSVLLLIMLLVPSSEHIILICICISPYLAPTERDSISRTLLPSLKVLGKTSPHPGSPAGPLWRELTVSKASFISLRILLIKSHLSLKDPSQTASLPWSPSGDPMKRDVCFQNLPLHIHQGPQ